MKKLFSSLISLVLIPVLAIRRYCINNRLPAARAEAASIIKFIDAQNGCDDIVAQKKSERLAHLMEHYGVTLKELGLVDWLDFQTRVNRSVASAHQIKSDIEDDLESVELEKALAKFPRIAPVITTEESLIKIC